MAAAMVLLRSRRKVLLIDEGKPRNERSQGIHNYLTRDGILPADFKEITHSELRNYGEYILKAKVMRAMAQPDGTFTVQDAAGNTYSSKKLLIATGVTDDIPDIPGMPELWGHGVYHCPYCDGWQLSDQVVGLYARKFNGYGMALSLQHLAKEVILFTDGASYLKPLQYRHLTGAGVRIHNTRVTALNCDAGKLTCVTLADGRQIACNSLFTYNGIRYNNELVLQLGGKCNNKGATLINRKQECSVPDVYVAGDTVFDMQFVTVAAAEGVKAAVAIHNALLKEHNAAMAARYAPKQKSAR